MSLPSAIESREYSKFKESSSVAGQAAVVVVNPDGSSIGTAGTTATAYSIFNNYGSNATLVVKASSGSVYSLSCYNANASTRYIQLHNRATVPTGGETPQASFPVFSNSETVIGTDFFGSLGESFSTGICFAFSTTQGTYTAGTAADQFTQVRYA